jgi:hypothetical protein
MKFINNFKSLFNTSIIIIIEIILLIIISQVIICYVL